MTSRSDKSNLMLSSIFVFLFVGCRVHDTDSQLVYPHFSSFYRFQQYPILNDYRTSYGGGYYRLFHPHPKDYGIHSSNGHLKPVHLAHNTLKFSDLLHEKPVSAYVELVEANGSEVKGTLFIEQKYPFKTVTIHGRIYGLKKGLHGFHVHQNGKLGNNCKDAGPHFNPFKVVNKLNIDYAMLPRLLLLLLNL